MRGYVYVFSNPSYKGCLKIGKARHPKLRVKQLSGETGVLYRFRIEACFKVEDYTVAESQAHMLLDYCRVKPNKEFFKLSIEDAVLKLSSLFGEPKFIRSKYLENLESKIKEIKQDQIQRNQNLMKIKQDRAKMLEENKLTIDRRNLRLKIIGSIILLVFVGILCVIIQ